MPLDKVFTNDETNVFNTGFTLNGSINPAGLSSPVQWQFRYSTTQSAIANDTNGSGGSGAGWTSQNHDGVNFSVSKAITGLTANTTYYWRLWLKSGNTYYSSNTLSQITAENTTISYEQMADSASQTDAFNVQYKLDTNGNHCKVEVLYGTASNAINTVGLTTFNVLTTASTLQSGTLTGLTPNTLYYWKVRATVNGTSAATDSNSDSRTTLANSPSATYSSSSIGSSNATVNATITHLNCGDLTWKFEWGSSSGNYTANSGTTTISDANSGTSNVTHNITGLSQDTTYYWRLVMTNTNPDSPFNGAEQSFYTTDQRYAVINPPIPKVGYRFDGQSSVIKRYRERNKPEFAPMFKTAVVANRTAYLGNVKYTESDGSVHRHADRILKSKPAKVDLFTKSGYLDVVVEDGDEIIKLEEYGDRLLQFKRNVLYIIDLNSGGNESLRSVHPMMGIANQAASIRTDRGVIFVNEYGCYLYDGNNIRNLLIGRRADSFKIDIDVWANFITDYSQVGYVPKKGFVVVVDSAQNATSSGNSYIFDMNTESWVYANQKLDGLDKTNFIIDNKGRLLFVGNGSIGQFYCITGDSGSTKYPDIVTRELDFDDPSAFKKVYKVYITYKGTITNGFPQLQYDVDGSGNWENAEDGQFYNVGLNKWARGVFKLKNTPIKCQSIKIRIYNSGQQSVDMAVNDIALEYRTIKGRVSDTGSSLDLT